eukprot:2256209-Rhodomonas_salina.1
MQQQMEGMFVGGLRSKFLVLSRIILEDCIVQTEAKAMDKGLVEKLLAKFSRASSGKHGKFVLFLAWRRRALILGRKMRILMLRCSCKRIVCTVERVGSVLLSELVAFSLSSLSLPLGVGSEFRCPKHPHILTLLSNDRVEGLVGERLTKLTKNTTTT